MLSPDCLDEQFIIVIQCDNQNRHICHVLSISFSDKSNAFPSIAPRFILPLIDIYIPVPEASFKAAEITRSVSCPNISNDIRHMFAFPSSQGTGALSLPSASIIKRHPGAKLTPRLVAFHLDRCQRRIVPKQTLRAMGNYHLFIASAFTLCAPGVRCLAFDAAFYWSVQS